MKVVVYKVYNAANKQKTCIFEQVTTAVCRADSGKQTADWSKSDAAAAEERKAEFSKASRVCGVNELDANKPENNNLSLHRQVFE